MNSTHTTRKQAAAIARELKAAGYRCKAADAYGYICNIIRNMGGADMSAQAEVRQIISGVIYPDGAPSAF